MTIILASDNSARAQSANRAGLVVRFGDGHSEATCVNFAEPSITGYELLRRSGQPISADLSNGMGVAICKIGSDGCSFPAQDCFCKFVTEQSYWSYWTMRAGNWAYQSAGASGVPVKNGDIQGWSWARGTQTGPAANKPPVIALDQICGVTSATFVPNTSTPTRTATASPAPPEPIIGGGGVPLPTVTPITPQPAASATQIAQVPTPSVTGSPTQVAQPTSAQSATITPAPTAAQIPTAIPTMTVAPTYAALASATLTPTLPMMTLTPIMLPVRRLLTEPPTTPSSTAAPQLLSGLPTATSEPPPSTLVAAATTSIVTTATAGSGIEDVSGNRDLSSPYLLFGGMAAVLLAAIGFVWRRK